MVDILDQVYALLNELNTRFQYGYEDEGECKQVCDTLNNILRQHHMCVGRETYFDYYWTIVTVD